MQNIDIHLKPSKIAIFLNLFLWLGSIGAVISLHQAIGLKIAALLLIVGYGIRLGMSSHAIRGLKHISGEHWLIRRNQGECMAILRGDSTVTLWLCVLRFTIPGEKSYYSCLLFRDSFEFDMYRRLLVRLRCSKGGKLLKNTLLFTALSV